MIVEGRPACPAPGADLKLTGAGSTFDFPLFSKWIDRYEQLCQARVNYQSIGSGAGIAQTTARTVDFGASDGIMTDDQIAKATAAGGPILHIAITSGAEAIVYNLPGIKTGQLKLTGELLADVFLGKIKKWNDPQLKELNPGVALPNAPIAVIHRSDGSGTTFVFTNYLSKVSAEWKSRVGYATSVSWPTGFGGQGNESVASQVARLPGGIGYVELTFAKQTTLSFAQVRNKAGKFVEPTLAGTTAAAAGIEIPDDMKVLITDSSDPDAYPISGFSWVLAYVNQSNSAKGQTLASYLWWQIHTGQKYAEQLNYAPLPDAAVKKAEALVLSLRCSGQPCLMQGQ